MRRGKIEVELVSPTDEFQLELVSTRDEKTISLKCFETVIYYKIVLKIILLNKKIGFCNGFGGERDEFVAGLEGERWVLRERKRGERDWWWPWERGRVRQRRRKKEREN